MNPSIQHFTILNKDSDSSFEKPHENKIIREIPKIEFINEKKEQKQEIEKKSEVPSMKTNLLQSLYGMNFYFILIEREFVKENEYLLSLEKESTSLNKENTSKDILDNTSLKNRKHPALVPLVKEKKKRIRKSRARPKK